MSNDLHIVFGAGPLGRSVINELAKQGKRTRVITRSGKMPNAPDKVEVISGDAYDSNNVRELTKEASVVYQCAQPGYTEWVEKFPPLQKAIIEGVAANRAKLIIGENLYMYGDTDGTPLAAHQSGKVQIAIGRGSDFFGPYVLGSAIGERVFYPPLAGKAASVTGNVDIPHTITYVEDFGKALVILGEREEALGQTWHVPNDQPTITQRQFAKLIFDEIGFRRKYQARVA